jgi:hypothetical protein
MKITNCQKSPLSIKAEISGYRHRSVTCLDWLQMDSRGTIQISEKYPIKDTYKSTLVFKKLYEIHNHNFYVASLVSQPIASFLPRDLNLIKMLNKELYYYRPCFRLNTIIHEIGLLPLQPSRIDLAIDFNHFAYGFKPETLIYNFFNNKFLKVGMTNYIINGNQEKFNKTHYLKFTKKDCNVDVYLYNKSKELREVKNKPWIAEMWKRAGLDLSKDVWRLEFSLHNPRFIVRDNVTGITDRFNWLMLDNKEYLNTVIYSLINKYFDFRRNTYIKDRKAMPKVKLFMGINDTTITWDRSASMVSNKADKLFLKKLGLLNDEVREIYTDIEKDTNSVINYFKITRGL